MRRTILFAAITLSILNTQACPADRLGLHTGSAQKHAEVHKWLTKAAEQGDPSCQYNVGMMYLEGLGGVTQDHQEALKWFQKAAGQGHQGANYLLKKLKSDSGLNAKRYR
jgi:TPR repeat protein